MKGFLDTVRKMGMAPIMAIAGVMIGMVAIGAYLELQGVSTSRMTLLYNDLDLRDSAQIVDQLDHHQIPYRVEADGKRIMVAGDDVFTARAMLAKEGLPASGTIGNELFDKNNDLTLTEFEQDVKRSRALEGELARTIQAMRGIAHARVHLVLPHKQPFSHQPGEAQASIMLTLAGNQTMTEEGSQSIINLVAAAVPGLRPENITLVDSHLHLLARAGDPEDMRTRSMLAEDLSRKIGLRMAGTVEQMLERSLGSGHVHAEASVRINFDKTNETLERFDPDSTVVRSTQNITSNNKTTDRTGPVSLQNNLPNADAAAPTSGSQEGKQEETTNYEITKTIHTTSRDQPQVDRISLAVMVDGVDEVGADGKHAWHARDQQDLDRIERLAKSAIGYDEKRGDRVEVVSMPFTQPVEPPESALTARADRPKHDLTSLAEAVVLGVGGIITIVVMTRSIVKGLSGSPVSMTLAAPPIRTLPNGEQVMVDSRAIAAFNAGHAVVDPAQPALTDESTVTMPPIEGPLRASSIRRLIELASGQPDTTLTIIRGWMSSEHG